MKLFLSIGFFICFFVGLKQKHFSYRGCSFDYRRKPFLYIMMLIIYLFASVLCFLWFLEIV